MAERLQPSYSFTLNNQWQAHCGPDPIAPPRMFQRSAINDLPKEAAARPHGAGFAYREPYRVVWVPSDIHILGPNWPPE